MLLAACHCFLSSWKSKEFTVGEMLPAVLAKVIDLYCLLHDGRLPLEQNIAPVEVEQQAKGNDSA